MSLFEQYKIAMTSETTPPPFKSLDYLVFDGDELTSKQYYGNSLSFTITIAEKIILDKIIICYTYFDTLNLGTINGMDSNNNKVPLSFTTTRSSSDSVKYIEATIDNNKSEFIKYNFILTNSQNGVNGISEIKLYSGFNKSIISNNQICGYDDENNLVNYNDINLLHEKYGLTLQKLNNNIDKIDQYYPFKIIKRKV